MLTFNCQHQQQIKKIVFSQVNFFTKSPPAQTTDKVACIFFPLAFLVFNIIYWPYYMSESDYNNADIIDKILDEIWSSKVKKIPG